MMKVKFVECSDEQASFCGGEDPREHLKINEIYELENVEVHSWHTRYFIKGFDGMWFNSVCFEEVV